MNDTEADRLAGRIINTWNGGPHKLEWVDTLAELDAGTAGTAFIRLRAKREHAPTIAAFLGEYNSLHTSVTDPIPGDCSHRRCGGDGWITVEYDAYVADKDGTPVAIADASGPVKYRGSVPCTCPMGTRNEKVWQSIRGSRRRVEPVTQGQF